MPERVLIYEDNDALRKSLEELLMLSDEFVVVSTARDCLSVEEDIRQLNPDVILMDIVMPGMNITMANTTVVYFNFDIFWAYFTAVKCKGFNFFCWAVCGVAFCITHSMIFNLF